MTDPQFPAPQPGDSDDVVLALETARVLFLSGETEEAAVRLRRAAEAAEHGGNDQRALALARAAADLTAAAASSPGPGDVSAAPPAQPAAAESLPPPRGPQGPSSLRPAGHSAAPREGAGGKGRQSRPPPLPPSARRAPASEAREVAEPEVTAAEPETGAKASPSFPSPGQAGAASPSISPRSPSGRGSAPPSPGTGDDAPRPLLSKRPPKPEQPKRSPTAAPAGERAAVMGDRPPKPPADAPDLANAVRVALKPSARDERLLMMRLLKPGEEPAPGYRPALVVMLDSGGNGAQLAK